jgi:hypothetical protein
LADDRPRRSNHWIPAGRQLVEMLTAEKNHTVAADQEPDLMLAETFRELALHTSPGCRAFLDDIGPSPRPIKKLQLVRDDLLAGAWFGELGRPGEIGGPLGKYQFCHDVFIVRRNRE